MSKLKNIIIFIAVAGIFILIYIFFIKPSPDQSNLVSSPSIAALPDINNSGTNASIPDGTSSVARDFLVLLLSVKNIKLDDTIFSDNAFNSLRDSSIVLVPDGTEGRPNPFAQFGAELPTAVVAAPVAGPSGSTPPAISGTGRPAAGVAAPLASPNVPAGTISPPAKP